MSHLMLRIVRRFGRALPVVCGLIAIARPSAAQITTGTMAGTVVDAQGGVIPGATVVARQRNAGHHARAGRDGHARQLRRAVAARRYLPHRRVDAGLQDALSARRLGQRQRSRRRRDDSCCRWAAPEETIDGQRGPRPCFRPRPASGRRSSRPPNSRTCRSRPHDFQQFLAILRRRQRHDPDRRRRTGQLHDRRRVGDGHRQQRADGAA